MTADELTTLREVVAERHRLLSERVAELAVAASEEPSTDIVSDTLLEGYFLQLFTGYEQDIERLFLHYVTGGAGASGQVALSYLQVGDESIARRLVRAGWKFLSWAKPDNIREIASTYIQNGWPLADMMAGRTQELADCERIRNRIAHRSIEADLQYRVVQRNLFGTERLFDMSPGHLLRTRHRQARDLTIVFYSEAMRATLDAIIDPPA
jgi:hypothetical protein